MSVPTTLEGQAEMLMDQTDIDDNEIFARIESLAFNSQLPRGIASSDDDDDGEQDDDDDDDPFGRDELYTACAIGRCIRTQLRSRRQTALYESAFQPLIIAVMLQASDARRNLTSPAVLHEALRELARQAAAIRSFPMEPCSDLVVEYQLSLREQRKQHREQSIAAALNGSTDAVANADGIVQLPVRPPCAIIADRVDFASSGVVRICPERTENEVRSILGDLPDRFSLVTPFGIVPLCLANPLPLPQNPACGFVCDTCNRKNIHISYQAIRNGFDDQRSNQMTYANCQGFDMCVGCAVYYADLSRAELRNFLTAALASDRRQDGDDDGDGEGKKPGVMQRLERTMYPELTALEVERLAPSPSTSTETDNATTTAAAVNLRVGVAPLGSHVVAWWVSSVDEDLLPPSNWRQYVPVMRHQSLMRTATEASCLVKSSVDDCGSPARPSPERDADALVAVEVIVEEEEEERVCCICLETLRVDADGPLLLQTNCHHWFHDVCIREAVLGSGSAVQKPCPYCRHPVPLGPGEPPSVVVQSNVYRIVVNRPPPKTTPGGGDGPMLLAVGATISATGNVTHAVDLANVVTLWV